MNEWRGFHVQLVESFLSVYRKMRNSLRELGVRTYAIVVAAEYVDDFDIPGAEICDRWDTEDESVIFVVRSKKELRVLSQIDKGIISVTRM